MPPDDQDAHRRDTSRQEPQRVVLPGELNVLGRAVYAAGAVLGLAARTAGALLGTVQSVWDASERAFHAELDGGVEDARIIEEQDEGDQF